MSVRRLFPVEVIRDADATILDSRVLFCFFLPEALKEVAEIATQLQSSLIRLENFQKLTELQRDLIGIENLTAPGRVSAVTPAGGQGALVNWLRAQRRVSDGLLVFLGVHTRGVFVQAHQERTAAENVLPG